MSDRGREQRRRGRLRHGLYTMQGAVALLGSRALPKAGTALGRELRAWRDAVVADLGDVDLRGRTLQLRAASAKNKRAKVIPLAGDLLALLERRAAERDPAWPFVFRGRGGGRLGDFRKAWRRACKGAGLRGTLVHDLRRSAARNAVRSGVPEQVVMELGGWRTRSVFARYNVTSERDLADALERVS